MKYGSMEWMSSGNEPEFFRGVGAIMVLLTILIACILFGLYFWDQAGW